MKKILLFTIILYFFFGCSKSYSTQLEEGFTTKWIEEREGFKNKEDLKRIHWEISNVFEAQQESYVYDVKTENDSIYFRQEAFHGVECEGGGVGSVGEPPPQLPTVQNIEFTTPEDTPKTFAFMGSEPQNLAHLISKIIGYSGTISFDSSMPDGVMKKLMDSRKLYSLGWQPNISLEKGLEMTYRDFKNKFQ